jgi:hypothetical protein
LLLGRKYQFPHKRPKLSGLLLSMYYQNQQYFQIKTKLESTLNPSEVQVEDLPRSLINH